MPDETNSTPPPASPSPSPQTYQRAPRAAAEKPRRVRGGVRLSRDWPPTLNHAGRSWLGCFQRLIDGDHLREGLEYAQAGQTRRIEYDSGVISALVQGRQTRAYRTEIRVATSSPEDWERLIIVMADQAIFAAKLLAGEVPDGVDEVVAGAGARLFDVSPEDITPSCACDGPTWCKHIACVALLAAEALQRDAFMMFRLRGLPAADFLERLRQRRALTSADNGLAFAYTHQVIPGAEAPSPPLEEQAAHFWDAGRELDRLETRIQPPEVSNAILRRLGQSPFEGRFPLVGLLATCYETISRSVIERSADQESDEVEDDDTDR
ncbi:MAG: hypothetical protein KDA21_02875 [Phycisphaerales bacterium]|nr:hypothetical protein [Phycisphaerales bacterium]